MEYSKHLLRIVNQNSIWPEHMKAHLQSFPDLDHLGMSLAEMGAPNGWETEW